MSQPQRGFITPVLFLRQNVDPVFNISQDAFQENTPAPAIASTSIGTKVPRPLVQAVQQGRCLPVIGHQFLTARTSRRGNPAAPNPMRLARLLASQCEFPHDAELEVDDTTAEWWSHTLLQRVCQYYVSPETDLGLYELRLEIQRLYDACDVPESFRHIAEWELPGAICTYFDGLLARAFEENRRGPVVLADAGQQVENGPEPRLVHVHGIARETSSLVLTETDNDKLIDRLEQSEGTRSCMITGEADRVLLMVGISPRDMMVRRLASILLRADAERGSIPIFFVDRSNDTLSREFWSRFDVRWNDIDPIELIEHLTAVSKGDR